MNILVSSGLLSLAIIFLADSIRQMRPHRKKKKQRKQNRSKEQPMPRAHVSVIDLHMTDLRRGGENHD